MTALGSSFIRSLADVNAWATLLFVAFAASSGRADAPSDWAEHHFHDVTAKQLPAIVVLVARNGKVLFQGAYGYADLDANSAATLETKFRIGSVTKQFTAAAILKLAEQGKLAVSDPLAKYFPGIPNAKEITLRHLLTHTSGLHSYTDRPEFYAGVTKAIEPAALIDSMKNDVPEFAPGTKWKYCNSGFFLLGEIVAKVSGRPLAEYLRAEFFEPLGMKDTGIYVNTAPPAGAARGYGVEAGKAKPALEWDMSWAGGAGALYSTVGDLFRWNEALYGGHVLNAESLKAMTTANPPPGGEGLKYGFGLAMADLERLPAMAHGGGLQGWSSYLAWFPEQRFTVVALGNALPPIPQFAPNAVAMQLVKHFLAEEIAKLPPPMEAKGFNAKGYADYVGTYDYLTAVMTVTLDGQHLFAQLTGQPKYEILPRGKEEFFWKVTDAQVRFVRDDNGKVIAAQHTQNGNTFRAARLGAEGEALKPEELDAFTGQYQYGPGAVLTVTRVGSQLFAQLSGQGAAPIFATGPGAFEWHVVQAKIRFAKGEDWNVMKAIHEQNGATIDAPRVK